MTYLILIACLLIINVTIVVELSMGRKFGRFQLFAPNSRGLVDVYTMSHIIHGFALYGICVGHFDLSLDVAVMIAVFCECLWEVYENTPHCINKYRRTITVDYAGDTVLNSMSDITFMVCGFWSTCFVPWGATAGCIVSFELLALAVARNNLTLNVVMLIYPFEAVKKWQESGE